LLKVWSSARDERTREDHMNANGQRVKKEQDFTIGDKKMKYPGDPRGGASQVVNCRCSFTHVVDESAS
ncbi:MAG: hypothetical protein NXI00_20085, partial [Cytophagales bacterium]|nr:hypothetical protein [Cytophagales bacterium]